MSAYLNQFWTTFSTRIAYSTDWTVAARMLLGGAAGQSANALRDIFGGGDNYYDRYLQWPGHRFEVSRAMRSVYDGPYFYSADDFTNYSERAIPVSVTSGMPTEIWWGNSLGAYPRLEDYSDADAVMFRGLAGMRYEIRALGLFGDPTPTIGLYRVSNGQVQWLQSSTNGVLITDPPLQSTDWYVAEFWSGTTSVYRGSIRLAVGSDDFSADLDHAYPVPHGVIVTASATDGDRDAFQIDVPEVQGQTTSLTIEYGGLSAALIEVRSPLGSFGGPWYVPAGQSLALGAVEPGLWRWIVQPLSAGTYTTRPLLSCPLGSTGCTVDVESASVRFAWGDWFAGRITSTSNLRRYTVNLDEREVVSVGITDSAPNSIQPPNCQLAIEVRPPWETTRYFGFASIFRWDDGGVSGPSGGNVVRPGGSFQALNAGTYEIRVRSTDGNCPFYRLYVARTGVRGPQYPAW